jgi:pimeloyl-ACP methyl ester carboxylesterase
LEYHEEGAGEPLLLIHGAPTDHRMWLDHCAELADSFRAIALTLRYFGKQPWSSGWPPFGMRLHADDLIAFIEKLGAGAVHAVAWSYGGHVALTAASERPELFKTLLVYEPGTPTYVTDPNDLATYGADAGAMFGPAIAAVQAGDHEAAVRILLNGSGRRDDYFASQSERDKRIQLENARVMPLLFSQTPPPELACETLTTLRVPTVVAWGERTRPLFEVVSRCAARCIGGERHVCVPGATHMWPQEEPRQFCELVRRSVR